jgi:hypothetical protein
VERREIAIEHRALAADQENRLLDLFYGNGADFDFFTARRSETVPRGA